MSITVYGAPAELEYTVHGGWALALARLLDFHGCDSEVLFRHCELPLNEIRDSQVRVPEKNMSLLWKLGEKEIGDSAYALEMHRFITPTTFHALGMALWSSTSLHDALVRLCRYGKVLSNGGIKTFDELEDCYCFTVSVFRDTGGPVIPYHAVDAFFAALLTICRSISRPDYAPLNIELERMTPEDPDRFSAFFTCPVQFEATENRMFFDKISINKPLITGDSEAAIQAEQLTALRLAELEKEDTINLVYSALVELLPSGELSESRVAAELSMPIHQLQRRLAEENTNYRRILDHTRKELALHYIGSTKIQLTEISFLLGFSEQTNFTRAFKRWTGIAPGQYRSENQ